MRAVAPGHRVAHSATSSAIWRRSFGPRTSPRRRHGRTSCRPHGARPVASSWRSGPERLALHELLVRVTADFSVPDGSKIEDLGINFRQIVSRDPCATTSSRGWPRSRRLRRDADAGLAASIDAELASTLPGTATTERIAAATPQPRIRCALSRGDASTATAGSGTMPAPQDRVIAEWEAKATRRRDALQRAACRALARVASALLVRHGRVWGSREIDRGARHRHRLQRPRQRRHRPPDRALAARKRPPPRATALLPRQDRPIVMNTKGASASGKSTLRPLQTPARRRHRRELERVRADQPGHLAQAAARLRHAGRSVQVRRRVHRRRVADRRPEARPLHGAQGRARAT